MAEKCLDSHSRFRPHLPWAGKCHLWRGSFLPLTPPQSGSSTMWHTRDWALEPSHSHRQLSEHPDAVQAAGGSCTPDAGPRLPLLAVICACSRLPHPHPRRPLTDAGVQWTGCKRIEEQKPQTSFKQQKNVNKILSKLYLVRFSSSIYFIFLLKLPRNYTENQDSRSFLFRRICSKCFFHDLLTWLMYTFGLPPMLNEHKYWLSSINNMPGLNKVESSHYWLQFLFKLLVKHHFFHWGPPSASKSLPVLGWALQTQDACARRHRGNWPAHRSTLSNWAKEAAVGEDGTN